MGFSTPASASSVKIIATHSIISHLNILCVSLRAKGIFIWIQHYAKLADAKKNFERNKQAHDNKKMWMNSTLHSKKKKKPKYYTIWFSIS